MAEPQGVYTDALKRLAATLQPQQGPTMSAPTMGDRVSDAMYQQMETLKQQPLAQVYALLGSLMDKGFRGNLPPWAQAAMTVYHGSPYKFDRFDMSKVGTGEGAQAYGHGLYFAENPEVAKAYQSRLSGRVSYGSRRIADSAHAAAAKNLLESGYGFDDALAALKKAYPAADESDLVVALRASEPGATYHVDLPDEAISKMLDWDAPIGQQPIEIQQAAERALAEVDPALLAAWKKSGAWEHVQGSTLYQNALAADKWPSGAPRFSGRHNQPLASDVLRKHGIPGIKYYDGMSRGQGQGTRNFVVFDDALPKIVGQQ